MLSTRTSKLELNFQSRNLDHVSFEEIKNLSFQSLGWIEKLFTLVALDPEGVLRFLKFDSKTDSLQKVVSLDELLPEMKGKTVERAQVSRNGLTMGILEKYTGGSSLKVLNLSNLNHFSLGDSESIEVGAKISDFSVSDNEQFISIRTDPGLISVWETSPQGTFTRATPTDIAVETGTFLTPKVSLSGQGTYFSVFDSKSSKILVFRLKKFLEGGVQLQEQGQGYQPSIEIETRVGLQKMEIGDNERFAVCLFNGNSIKLFSIQHQDHTDDEVFGLRKRNSSLLGAKRFEQILEQLKKSQILHIEESFDGSKTFTVSKGPSGSKTKNQTPKKESKDPREENNSQLSMLDNSLEKPQKRIAIDENLENEESETNFDYYDLEHKQSLQKPSRN